MERLVLVLVDVLFVAVVVTAATLRDGTKDDEDKEPGTSLMV